MHCVHTGIWGPPCLASCCVHMGRTAGIACVQAREAEPQSICGFVTKFQPWLTGGKMLSSRMEGPSAAEQGSVFLAACNISVEGSEVEMWVCDSARYVTCGGTDIGKPRHISLSGCHLTNLTCTHARYLKQ
jgi:hypothetical protein